MFNLASCGFYKDLQKLGIFSGHPPFKGPDQTPPSLPGLELAKAFLTGTYISPPSGKTSFPIPYRALLGIKNKP